MVVIVVVLLWEWVIVGSVVMLECGRDVWLVDVEGFRAITM